MIRKQLYLDEDLDRDLKRLAARTGESEAAHVRAALRDYLHDRLGEPDDGSDPILAMIGLAGDDDGPTDTALEHDHYLYGAPRLNP